MPYRNNAQAVGMQALIDAVEIIEGAAARAPAPTAEPPREEIIEVDDKMESFVAGLRLHPSLLVRSPTPAPRPITPPFQQIVNLLRVADNAQTNEEVERASEEAQSKVRKLFSDLPKRKRAHSTTEPLSNSHITALLESIDAAPTPTPANPERPPVDMTETNRFFTENLEKEMSESEKENHSDLIKQIREFSARKFPKTEADYSIPAPHDAPLIRDMTDAERVEYFASGKYGCPVDQHFEEMDKLVDKECSQYRLARAGYAPCASNPPSDDTDSVRAHTGSTADPALENLS
jgi:hypothetical protein